jgi:hypothetical protein
VRLSADILAPDLAVAILEKSAAYEDPQRPPPALGGRPYVARNIISNVRELQMITADLGDCSDTAEHFGHRNLTKLLLRGLRDTLNHRGPPSSTRHGR